MTRTRQMISGTLLATLLVPANAAVFSYNANGANPAAIQATVDQFRTDLGGVNNGVNASGVTTGRREINWDGVPVGFSDPNPLPGGFFNQNSQRGLNMTTVGGVSPFFSVFTPVTGSDFATFSAPKLLGVGNTTQFDLGFFVPLTGPALPGSAPATVSGFGIVFSDIDNTGNGTNIQAFDRNGNSLAFLGAIDQSSGLSFAAIRVDGLTERIARVRVTLGNTSLTGTEGGAFDIVAADDFIFGEPVAQASGVPEPGTFLLSGFGILTAAGYLRRRRPLIK